MNNEQLQKNINELHAAIKHQNTAVQNQKIKFLPLVRSEDENVNQRLNDYWENQVANLNTGNSIMQHSQFLLKRLGYTELSILATDDIINNAIETIARETLSNWGNIIVESEEHDDVQEIQTYLEKRLHDLDFRKKLYTLIQKALIFGGSFFYFNIGGLQDLEKPLILAKETNENKLMSINVLEAWQLAPAIVNMSDSIKDNYMNPTVWHVSGSGNIHSTRVYPLVFFNVPTLIKPLFNFLGVSLVQLMKEKVKACESMRQSLADIFLRFRTNIIRTPSLLSMNSETIRQRVELLNMGVNNFSTLLLSDNENFEQSITPTAGLDKLYAQAMEGIASSARIPINKLFGQTPTGLNNTGEYDIASFYDTIKGYQVNTIKPCVEYVLKLLLNEQYDITKVRASFEFNPLENLKKQDSATLKNLEVDFYAKLIEAGIITQEDALKELQKQQYLSDDIELNEEQELNGLEGFNIDLPSIEGTNP